VAPGAVAAAPEIAGAKCHVEDNLTIGVIYDRKTKEQSP